MQGRKDARDLKHYASSRFWRCFDALPPGIQELARKNYALLRQNPSHPSLHFKPVNNGRFRSVRIGTMYPDRTHLYWKTAPTL